MKTISRAPISRPRAVPARWPGASPLLFGRFLMKLGAFVSLEDISDALHSDEEEVRGLSVRPQRRCSRPRVSPGGEVAAQRCSMRVRHHHSGMSASPGTVSFTTTATDLGSVAGSSSATVRRIHINPVIRPEAWDVMVQEV